MVGAIDYTLYISINEQKILVFPVGSGHASLISPTPQVQHLRAIIGESGLFTTHVGGRLFVAVGHEATGLFFGLDIMLLRVGEQVVLVLVLLLVHEVAHGGEGGLEVRLGGHGQ